MQDLVLQYLKKTVLRPRAVGKSEFLGGQVIVQYLSKEKVLLLFLAFYLGWRVNCPSALIRWPCHPTILVFHTT